MLVTMVGYQPEVSAMNPQPARETKYVVKHCMPAYDNIPCPLYPKPLPYSWSAEDDNELNGEAEFQHKLDGMKKECEVLKEEILGLLNTVSSSANHEDEMEKEKYMSSSKMYDELNCIMFELEEIVPEIRVKSKEMLKQLKHHIAWELPLSSHPLTKHLQVLAHPSSSLYAYFWCCITFSIYPICN
jgi:hypothetical protein